MMTNWKRMAALFLCIGLVLALAVSSAWIAHAAGHDCSGHDCPVCQMVAVSVNLLRTLGTAVFILSALFAVLRRKFAHRDRQLLCPSASDTLVSWKIRLNN